MSRASDVRTAVRPGIVNAVNQRDDAAPVTAVTELDIRRAEETKGASKTDQKTTEFETAMKKLEAMLPWCAR